MKNILLVLIFILGNSVFAQQSTSKEAFIEKWENSKKYLIELAESMPEEFYNFKPTERQMSFEAQLIHIKGNMKWLSVTYFTNQEYKKEKDTTDYTKAELIKLLNLEFDKVSKIIENTPSEDLKTTVDFFAGPKSKLQILNLLHDHLTHHRGQLIVYLNLNNIDPPNYTGW